MKAEPDFTYNSYKKRKEREYRPRDAKVLQRQHRSDGKDTKKTHVGMKAEPDDFPERQKRRMWLA